MADRKLFTGLDDVADYIKSLEERIEKLESVQATSTPTDTAPTV